MLDLTGTGKSINKILKHAEEVKAGKLTHYRVDSKPRKNEVVRNINENETAVGSIFKIVEGNICSSVMAHICNTKQRAYRSDEYVVEFFRPFKEHKFLMRSRNLDSPRAHAETFTIIDGTYKFINFVDVSNMCEYYNTEDYSVATSMFSNEIKRLWSLRKYEDLYVIVHMMVECLPSNISHCPTWYPFDMEDYTHMGSNTLYLCDKKGKMLGVRERVDLIYNYICSTLSTED
jgi:hypothetical protein